MNKLQKDFEQALESRKARIACLSKNQIHISLIHEYVQWQAGNISKNNKTVNRIKNRGDDKGMGLDCKATIQGRSKQWYVIFRTFSDPNIYIKDSGNEDLAMHYADESIILIFTNDPLKRADKEVTHYNTLTMEDIERLGWQWLPISDTAGNRNRKALHFRSKIVKPMGLRKIPLDGRKEMFSNEPDFWTAAKQKMI